jgi:hypothetical protein
VFFEVDPQRSGASFSRELETIVKIFRVRLETLANHATPRQKVIASRKSDNVLANFADGFGAFFHGTTDEEILDILRSTSRTCLF